MTFDSDPRSGTLQKFCPDFIDQPVAVCPGDDQMGNRRRGPTR